MHDVAMIIILTGFQHVFSHSYGAHKDQHSEQARFPPAEKWLANEIFAYFFLEF